PDEPVVVQDLPDTQWNSQPQARIRLTGLEEQHPNIRILAQSIRQHTPGRTGADDDVVKRGLLHLLSCRPDHWHAVPGILSSLKQRFAAWAASTRQARQRGPLSG